MNKNWNAAFKEFAQLETHDAVTARFECQKHHLALLDAHLDAALDNETALSLHQLIRHSLQITLANLSSAHFHRNEKWNLFDRKGVEEGIKKILADASLDEETQLKLFSSIQTCLDAHCFLRVQGNICDMQGIEASIQEILATSSKPLETKIQTELFSSIQTCLHAHSTTGQKWSIFDVEDVEAGIKWTLASFLKKVNDQTLNSLFTAIQQKYPSATTFFQSLHCVTCCLNAIHTSPHRLINIGSSLPIFISAKAFGQILAFILKKDLDRITHSTCATLLCGLTQAKRYEEAIAFAKMLITDPEQLNVTPKQAEEMYCEFIQFLCKEKRFNKLIEALEIVPPTFIWESEFICESDKFLFMALLKTP